MLALPLACASRNGSIATRPPPLLELQVNTVAVQAATIDVSFAERTAGALELCHGDIRDLGYVLTKDGASGEIASGNGEAFSERCAGTWLSMGADAAVSARFSIPRLGRAQVDCGELEFVVPFRSAGAPCFAKAHVEFCHGEIQRQASDLTCTGATAEGRP